MAHEIESSDVVGLRGEQAWHGLGTVIQDDLNAVQAAERFGLTYQIGQWPLVAQSAQSLAARAELDDILSGRGAGSDAAAAMKRAYVAFTAYRASQLDVSTHVANVRPGAELDAKNLLGIVGADYQVCQNLELAEFTDALAQTGRVTIESCGTIRHGKRVWFLAKGDAFNVGGTADEMRPYILVSNGHDGTQAIRVTPTTVRVVCSNTLHMVIPRAENERPETAAITIRHSGKISDKLEQARQALTYYGETLKRNVEMYEAMQAQRVTQEQAMTLFAGAYAKFWEVADAVDLASTDSAVRKLAERRNERMQSASEAFIQRWADEQSKLGIGSTAWSAFNALTGFIQHDKTARGADDAARVERRRESNLFGINATRTHEALAGALAMAS